MLKIENVTDILHMKQIHERFRENELDFGPFIHFHEHFRAQFCSPSLKDDEHYPPFY